MNHLYTQLRYLHQRKKLPMFFSFLPQYNTQVIYISQKSMSSFHQTQNSSRVPTAPPPPAPNLNFNDDSLLDADDSQSFDLRNQNYELRSKCNNLEYEKNKLSISYENAIKQMKQKYGILQRLLSQKNEKEDKNGGNYNQLRARCQYLVEQNELLKKEMQVSAEKNRITPNFNAPEMAEEMAALAYLQKPENLAQLEMAYGAANKQETEELKQKIAQLEKENQKINGDAQKLQKQNEKLKEQVCRVEAEKQETIRLITKDNEQHHDNILKFKDQTIEELKQEQISLNLQLNESRKLVNQLSSNQSDVTQQQKNLKLLATQIREKEAKIVELQENVNRIELQNSRVKSQKSKLQQEAKYFQNQKREVEGKRKLLQEELYKKENQYSEAKNAWFNQKMEIKKQSNSSKYQVQEEIVHLKGMVDSKEQENKRLRESLMNLNQQTDQLRQKEAVYLKKIQKMSQQISSLSSNIEKLIAENQISHTALSKRQTVEISEYERRVDILRGQISKSKDENIRCSIRLSQASKQQIRLQQELKHKEELIQILKIEQDQRIAKERQLDQKIKDLQKRNDEKDRVIRKLEEEIKNLKFDNRQLQIANDEEREKVNTLNKIKSDVENMNAQLKREKMHFQQKKKEEERIKSQCSSPKFQIGKKEGKTFSMLSSVPKNAEPMDLFELADNQLNKMPALSSKQSEDGKETILDLIRQLKAENNHLQTRIGEVQNQLDKKATDLSIKEEELKTLKSNDHYKPKDLNLQPLIETSKRTQFNAIFFENKISQLQKEVSVIKSMKQKQVEQQKKIIRKQMQQKYLNQIKKQNAYIHELQKQSNIYNSRQEEAYKTNASLKVSIEELSERNYQLEVQLSNNLQEVNSLLKKCKAYETRCNEIEQYSKQNANSADQYHKIKTSYDYIAQKYERQALMLKNANEQIRRLNDVLMVKESELKSVSSRNSQIRQSPNNSFMGRERQEEQDHSMREMDEYEKPSEADILRVWTQKRSGPSFSRI